MEYKVIEDSYLIYYFLALEIPIIVVLLGNLFQNWRSWKLDKKICRVDQKIEDHLKFCDEFRAIHTYQHNRPAVKTENSPDKS